MAEAEVDARATGDEGRGGGGGSVAEDGQPAAAKWGAVTVVLLALLVASVAAFLTSSLPLAGEGVGKGVQGAVGRAGEVAGKRAEPVEHAVGDAVGIPGFNSRLDAFRTWAALAWMKLRRPRADEPRYDAAAAWSAGSVADAAKRSFEMGKETVEQSAATTARATRDAAETAKEKVKGAASPPDGAEL
ncbi:unnamed protein product [Miscanthus lutarioriparius]|uniref:Uncharacterized protein n=1 Tax=Miscanthus lutarioriparius TaxID=422564 RepID=A0A811MU60_9POAL|nr:unnamed protein product [Miscanthus lutarioriparius]